MTEQIEKFDPSKLMDGVRDRIKATFVSLIPEDHWDKLVKKEIDDFFQQRTSSGYKHDTCSHFGQVVRGELEKIAQAKVREVLDKEYFSPGWDNGGPIVAENLKRLITENADEIFASVIGRVCQEMIQRMKQGHY